MDIIYNILNTLSHNFPKGNNLENIKALYGNTKELDEVLSFMNENDLIGGYRKNFQFTQEDTKPQPNIQITLKGMQLLNDILTRKAIQNLK